ncbi:MAG: sigma-70 family RNA polymerase sigma factor [Gemmatimonadales bacterium]|nr:sigma-70 family RNA polymerase sigma factor [Gemmatimonadales bacterium]
MTDRDTLAACLDRLRAGEEGALDRILPLVYAELRAIAGAQLRNERTGHTLSATALVHEAYVRLASRERMAPRDRSHFFAIAAQSMRRVLIDHARGRRRDKRGSGQAAVPLDQVEDLVGEEAADELIALDEALDRLSRISPRAAQLVERRYFAGLTMEEAAESLAISVRTAEREWVRARAWLRKEIAADLDPPPA